MAETSEGRRVNSRAATLIALHVLMFVYGSCGFFSKSASQQEFFSVPFFAFYAGMLAVLGIYAIGWQQILKRMPLTVAFANKAVTIIWGIAWGAIVFGEAITPPMVVGAALVMAGIVLFSIADGEERRAAEVPSDAVDGGDA